MTIIHGFGERKKWRFALIIHLKEKVLVINQRFPCILTMSPIAQLPLIAHFIIIYIHLMLF